MLTSAECRAQAEQKLAQAERDDRNRKRLITAAEAWLGKAVSRSATKIPVIESALWRCGFRGAELLRQTPLQHLQAVLTPEQLALEDVRRGSEDADGDRLIGVRLVLGFDGVLFRRPQHRLSVYFIFVCNRPQRTKGSAIETL